QPAITEILCIGLHHFCIIIIIEIAEAAEQVEHIIVISGAEYFSHIMHIERERLVFELLIEPDSRRRKIEARYFKALFIEINRMSSFATTHVEHCCTGGWMKQRNDAIEKGMGLALITVFV